MRNSQRLRAKSTRFFELEPIFPKAILHAATCLLAGCYSMSLLQEPTPLPPGGVRFGVGTEVGESGLSQSIALRVGVAPRTELRAKGSLVGGEVGVNVHAIDGEWADLMLMPHYFDADVDAITDEEPGSHMRGVGMPAVISAQLQPGPNPSLQMFVAPDVRYGRTSLSAARQRASHVRHRHHCRFEPRLRALKATMRMCHHQRARCWNGSAPWKLGAVPATQARPAAWSGCDLLTNATERAGTLQRHRAEPEEREANIRPAAEVDEFDSHEQQIRKG